MPLFGGGQDNIAFLRGDTAGANPNAEVVRVDATFWIETVQTTTADGAVTTSKQIRYRQTVVLSFKGLAWPHVSVGTLTPAVAPATVAH